jgi:hypothetical protein
MKKARLSHLFGLVVLAALILGCTPMISPPTPTPSPTQPLPTSTPITPTNTPVPTDTPTPTLTFTPVPTQSLSSMIQALIPVTQGNGAPEAAAYDPNKSGTHLIVIISPYEELESWNTNLPDSWRPVNISQAELIVMILYHEVEVERGRFRFTGALLLRKRVRIDTEVILREALTGKDVGTIFYKGGEPPKFPATPTGMLVYYGPKLDLETLQIWLMNFVEK